MKCRILSEIDGRMRVRLSLPRMSLKQADIVEEYLGAVAGVKSVKVFDRNCDVVVEYSDRTAVVSALSGFSFETCGITEPKPTGRELNREYQDKLAGVVMRRVLKKGAASGAVARGYLRCEMLAVFCARRKVAVA